MPKANPDTQVSHTQDTQGGSVLHIRCSEDVIARFRDVAEQVGATQGEALDALVAAYEGGMTLDEVEATAERARQRARAEQERCNGLRTEREQLEARVSDLRTAAAREAEISIDALNLLRSLVERGVSREVILRVGDVLIAAEMEPEHVARMLERAGGLQRWATDVQAALERAEALRDQFLREAGVARQRKEAAEAEAESVAKQVRDAAEGVQRARLMARQVEGAAHEFGVYLEFLSAPGGQVADWPHATARAIAGAVLFASLQAHTGEADADPEVEIPADMARGRWIPMRLRMSDLPLLLAPPQVYSAMLQETQARERQAAMVPVGTGGEG